MCEATGDSVLLEMMDALCDGTIDAESFEKLQKRLIENESERLLFCRYRNLHAGLYQSKPEAALFESPAAGAKTRRPVFYVAAAVAAAAVIIIVSIAWLMAPATTQSPAPVPSAPSIVATLTGADKAVFNGSAVPMEPGRALPTGPVRLASGTAQIMFDSTAVVDLVGPCDFEMTGPNGGRLTSGSLDAFVPDRAHGFTIDLPGGARVVDLGTSFHVRVDADGRSLVAVNAGRVELITPNDGTRQLMAGQIAMLNADGFYTRTKNLRPTTVWRSEDRNGAKSGDLGHAFDPVDVSEGLTIEAAFRMPDFSAWDDRRVWSILRLQLGKLPGVVLALQTSEYIGDKWGAVTGDPNYPGFCFGLVTGRQYVDQDVSLDGRDGRPPLKSLFDGRVHHLVGVYDRRWQLKSIYLDGQLISFMDTARLGDLDTNSLKGVVEIGKWDASNRSGREQFGGDLLGVAIYGNAMGRNQINDHFERWRDGEVPWQNAETNP